MSATITTPTADKQITYRGARDYDATLNGAYIGSFPTEQQAQVELDRLACDQAEDGTAIDPRTPFAIGALPTTLEVADTAIQSAYARLIATFATSPKVVERAARAVEIALHRSDLLAVLSATELTVRGSGSKPYRIHMEPLGTTCTCRDFWVAKRQAEHGGMCKHIIAAELIRMAEAEASAGAADSLPSDGITLNGIAGITLDGALFVQACALAQLSAQAVTFAVRDNLLRMSVGDAGLICGIALAGTTAGEPTAICMAADEFATMCAQLPPRTATCSHLAVALDATTVFVTDAELSFAAGATGITL